MHIVLLRDIFAAISSPIIFVMCSSVKKCARGEVNEEMLRQMFSVFEAEALKNIWKWRNYKYGFIPSFLHHADFNIHHRITVAYL